MRANKGYWGIFGVALVTLLSRVPFLTPGYGSDPDAWRIVLAARHLADTGEYIVSRFPGYPLVEIVMSLFAGSQPWVLNGLTAIMSVAAVIFFTMIARELGVRQYLWLGLGLAFTPLVFAHSVNTMDYVWALAFILAATWFALRHCAVAAGIALGLAVGCRPTSVILGLPLLLLLYSQRRELPKLGWFVVVSALTATFAFLPVVSNYGLSFMTYYRGDYPNVISIAKSLSVAQFGRMGAWALVTAAIGVGVWPGRFRKTPDSTLAGLRNFQRTALLVIGLWVALYLWLPLEPGYLIPAIPFFLLVLSRWLSPRVLMVVILMIGIGSFGHICRRDGLCVAGAVADHQVRKRNAAFVTGVLEQARSLPDGSLLVSAWWRPYLRLSSPESLSERVEFVYMLDSTRWEEARSEGAAIYYLPEIADFNEQVEHISLTDIGATPLDTGDK